MRNAVDLPQPEGPSRLMNSPLSTSIDMPESASVPLEKTLETCSMTTSGRLRVSGLVIVVASDRVMVRLFVDPPSP